MELFMGRNWQSRAFALIVVAFGFTVDAYGGEASAFPPPFDFPRGEGQLFSSSLITTYATGASSGAVTSAADPDLALPDLNTFYLETICPSGLYRLQCAKNKSNLNTPEFGNFNLSTDPIANNPLGIRQVSAVKLTYGAINVDGAAVTVSGGLVIPQLPVALIKGVVLYFHGTTIQRSNVPSNFVTPDNPHGVNTGMLLAALWATQGYVVVMPDYIGLGDDTAHPHPYVAFPYENAQSGLAMLNAASAYLFGASNSGRRMPLYITGYSEGGAYALEAGHLMQSNPGYALVLNTALKDVVPISGAFDLSGTMVSYLFDNVTILHNKWFSLKPLISAFTKPAVSADMALSFAYYADIAPTDIFANAFYVCNEHNRPNCGNSGNLDGLFYETNIDDGTALSTAFNQATATGWGLLNNQATPLLTTTYAKALQQADPTNPLYAALLAADTYQFTPQFPLALVSLVHDSVVTRVNTDVAFNYITEQNPSGSYQEYLVPNSDFLTPPILGTIPAQVDHPSELPFLAVLALNQFNLHP
jgi:hypothetical protein